MRRTVLTLAAAGALAACGGASDTPATDTTQAAAPAVAATPAVYTITAKDYAYEAPDTITAGMVTLRLVNQGPELHHAQLVRIDDGKTFADLAAGLKAMKPGSPPPPWIHDVAGPNAPVPGGEQSITQELAPGNYALICFIPSPDGTPHAMKGMVKALTVVPGAAGATAASPAADVTVKMTDYAWEISPALTAGKHVLKMENAAEQSHEMFIAQLAPGKTAADLAKWTETQQGPPPGKPIGGISGMAKGAIVYLPVDLEPGEYGLFCFLPDAKDGKPHIAHGMISQVTVK
ncbi:MAG: hypothetical protein V4617_17535 [Gemmatimonadota bacterium]